MGRSVQTTERSVKRGQPPEAPRSPARPTVRSDGGYWRNTTLLEGLGSIPQITVSQADLSTSCCRASRSTWSIPETCSSDSGLEDRDIDRTLEMLDDRSFWTPFMAMI